ncbi:hypothetical protein KCTC52924_00004 [Arenibacter antarcticus]|uniref:Peptidoglycan-binding protein LysM n=1 Tax=Arenibacter antarcticus TaxID=2040469 RepID=A0ABW5VD04_9FLAO|nr:hypothetical protein [Arenibacter sp. H213]MCM4169775.1 hypothetical protein [Arenibacter sp. H213]
MRKWTIFLFPVIIVFILLSFGFKPVKVSVPEALRVNGPTKVLFPNHKTILIKTRTLTAPPFLGTSYNGFKEALAFKESQGNYFTTNAFGYLGKYQFGIGTLELLGVYNATRFLNDPILQEKVFQTNLSRNKWILRRDIKRFVGKEINGQEITESGILAAAHLAGAGNVKKYLRSYGKENVNDNYGSTVSYYIKKFSGYDISHVAPIRNPRIQKI